MERSIANGIIAGLSLQSKVGSFSCFVVSLCEKPGFRFWNFLLGSEVEILLFYKFIGIDTLLLTCSFQNKFSKVEFLSLISFISSAKSAS